MNLKNTKNTRRLSEIDKRLTDSIVRSDRIDNLDEADVMCLLNENINVIIDLRKDKDRSSSVRNNLDFDYNIFDFKITEWAKLKEIWGEGLEEIIYDILPDQYLNYTEQKEIIFKIFDKIIRTNNGVLIMCHHGKDRTGVVIALLLLVAGIDKETIVKDYSLSSKFLKSNSLDEKDGSFESRPTVMEKFLDMFLKKYGDIDSYLNYIGIDEYKTQLLRQKLLN